MVRGGRNRRESVEDLDEYRPGRHYDRIGAKTEIVYCECGNAVKKTKTKLPKLCKSCRLNGIPRKCKNCNREFLAKDRRSSYCSLSCANLQRANKPDFVHALGNGIKRKVVSLMCRSCGSVFTKSGKRIGRERKQFFCDSECANDFQKYAKRGKRVSHKDSQRTFSTNVPCAKCGKEIVCTDKNNAQRTIRNAEAGKNAFCCRKCASDWFRAKRKRQLEIERMLSPPKVITYEADWRKVIQRMRDCECSRPKHYADSHCCDQCKRYYWSQYVRKQKGYTPHQTNVEFKTCKKCGKGFFGSKNKEYCNRPCAEAAREMQMRANGRYDSDITLSELIKRDGKKCCICGIKTERYNGTSTPTTSSIDHVIPISRGGTHTWENVKVACMSCNSSKHNKIEKDTQLPLFA